MLALDFVKANRETVERAIRDKGVDLDLDDLLALDAKVRALKTEIEAPAGRAQRGQRAVPGRQPPEEKAELGRKAKEAGARLARSRASLRRRKRRSRR